MLSAGAGGRIPAICVQYQKNTKKKWKVLDKFSPPCILNVNKGNDEASSEKPVSSEGGECKPPTHAAEQATSELSAKSGTVHLRYEMT